MVKINGAADPLRKTLLIIDEAHKLYGGEDLSSIERPDMNALHQALMNSYAISGNDSVRLLLMTATPMTQNPMELIELLNLCKPADEQMPKDFESFAKTYLNEDGKFTERGKATYLDDIAGYVSYLNREKDARQFSQPQIHNVHVPVTSDIELANRFDKKLLRNYMSSDVSDLKNQIVENNKELQSDLNDLDANRFGYLKDKCEGLEGSQLKKCNQLVNRNIRELVSDAKDEIRRIRENIKETRDLIKNRNLFRREKMAEIENNIERSAEDYAKYKESLFYSLKNKCSIKASSGTALKELTKEHPAIIKYDREIAEYEDRILNLKMNLKNDMSNYKKTLASMRKMMKSGVTEIERGVLKLSIENEKKVHGKTFKIKRKQMNAGIKVLKKTIKANGKLRKKKVNEIRKTIKKSLANEKREIKKIHAAEKKLKKTLRKQGELKDEVKHAFLKDLSKKYSDKIDNEIKDLPANKTKKNKA